MWRHDEIPVFSFWEFSEFRQKLGALNFVDKFHENLLKAETSLEREFLSHLQFRECALIWSACFQGI